MVVTSILSAISALATGTMGLINNAESAREQKRLAEQKRQDDLLIDRRSIIEEKRQLGNQATRNSNASVENTMQKNLNDFDAQMKTQDVNKASMDTASALFSKGAASKLTKNMTKLGGL